MLGQRDITCLWYSSPFSVLFFLMTFSLDILSSGFLLQVSGWRCHFVSRLESYCISVWKIARRGTTVTETRQRKNRQWNVLEITRLPLAGLRRTMQFSRIMPGLWCSFTPGNRIVSMESMEAMKPCLPAKWINFEKPRFRKFMVRVQRPEIVWWVFELGLPREVFLYTFPFINNRKHQCDTISYKMR